MANKILPTNKNIHNTEIYFIKPKNIKRNTLQVYVIMSKFLKI